MGIERYLCVGGVEVANPNRTLAYMRSLGNACQPVVPNLRRCCCPDWDPESTCTHITGEAVVIASADQFCFGIYTIDGLTEDAYIVELGIYPVAGPCEDGDPRPALPDADDPDWATFAGSADQLPLPQVMCIGGSGGDSWLEIALIVIAATTGCGWVKVTVTDAVTGAAFSVVWWLPLGVGGNFGSSQVSVDDGATWTQGLVDFAVPCPDAGLKAVAYGVWTGVSHSFQWAALLDTFGPFDVTIKSFTSGTPLVVGDLPATGDPGWVETFDGTVPTWDSLPDGFGYSWVPTDTPPDYQFGWAHVHDQDTGQTFDLVFMLNGPDVDEADWAGSVFSADYGATWFAPGVTVVTVVPIGPQVPVPDGAFTTPAADDAPWYDPAVPESADVLGVWLEEARLGVPWNRQARPALRGASLTSGRLGGRELQLAGWVYTRSEAATWYARQWLMEALAGDGCGNGSCELPSAEVWTHCDPETPGAGARTLKRVGLTAFDPEIEPEFPRWCGFKFEATLTAEAPELFLEPTTIVNGAPLLPLGSEPICNICNPCPEPVAPCTCGGLNEPPRVVQQPDPASVFCSPSSVVRSTYQFDAPNFWRDGTLIVTVDTGQDPDAPTEPLANLRIRGWANPAGIDPADVALLECQEPCIDLELGCVPPRSQFVVDGTVRRAYVVCAGEEQNGFAYLSSSGGQRFAWPDVSCYGLLVAIDADPWHTPPGAKVTVEFVLRERG